MDGWTRTVICGKIIYYMRKQGTYWSSRPQLWVGLAAIVVALAGLRPVMALPARSAVSSGPSQSVLSALTDVRVSVPLSPQPAPAAPPFDPGPDCTVDPCLALTFDDGPTQLYTPGVLDILERHHVHATFFVVGSHVPGNESLLRRMYSDGDEIGNHSWNHPDFTTLNPVQMEQQIATTQAAVTAAGVPAPTLFRPPYGAVNSVVRNHVPLTLALWNIDPEDWDAKSSQEIITHVNATAKPGGIVELHDTHQHTLEALDPLLTGLEQRHYQFVTISDLLNLAPGQRGAYYGR